MASISQRLREKLADDGLVLGTVGSQVIEGLPEIDGEALVKAPEVARQRHMHIVGTNGSGKSRFIRSLIQQDIEQGRGVCLIDPHGTLCGDILAWLANRPRLAKHRKIRYFDVGGGKTTIAFNPLQVGDPLEAHATAVRVADAIGRLFSNDDLRHQPRTMEVLVALLISLIEAKRPLADYPLFMNPHYRPNVEHFIEAMLNDATREQWRLLEKYKDNEFVEYVSSVARRFYKLISSPFIASIFSKTEDTINFRSCMDEGEILLFNLVDTKYLEAGLAQLFGLLLLSTLFAECKLRDNTQPYFVYLDEAHRFLGGGDIARMFEEARKFGLHLVLAHQNLGQLRDAGERVFSTVMNEAEIKAVFKIQEPEDARYLVQLLFRNGLIDPGKVKDVLTKPTVVGYSIGHLRAWMSSNSEIRGSGTNAISGSAISLLPDGGMFVSPTQIGEVQSNAKTTLDSIAKGSASATSQGETLMPILEERPSATWPIEEQIFMLADEVASLQRQHAIVTIGGNLTVKFRALDVPDEPIGSRKFAEFMNSLQANNPYLKPFEIYRLQVPAEQPRPPLDDPDYLE